MRGSNLIFDCVDLVYYKCHKRNPNRGRSFIESPDKKTTTIKPINKKCNQSFQYAVKNVLNHEEIKKYRERMTKIKLL